MAASAWQLEHPTLGTFPLNRAESLSVRAYDLGFPIVREVLDDRPDQNGADDDTSRYGARVVTLDLELHGGADTRQQTASRLRGWLLPSLRPVLSWTSSLGHLRAVVRASTITNPVPMGMAVPNARVPWIVAAGIFESYDQAELVVYPGTGTETGRTYDLTFDRPYPAMSAPGSGIAINLGNAPVDLIARLYGPCTNPIFRINGGTGYMRFNANGGLTVAAGDYVQIDTANYTCLVNGSSGSSCADKLEFSTLVWPRLAVGSNDVRFEPATSSSPSQAVVNWRHGFI